MKDIPQVNIEYKMIYYTSTMMNFHNVAVCLVFAVKVQLNLSQCAHSDHVLTCKARMESALVRWALVHANVTPYTVHCFQPRRNAQSVKIYEGYNLRKYDVTNVLPTAAFYGRCLLIQRSISAQFMAMREEQKRSTAPNTSA